MNKKKKILHLMTSLGAGGAETNLLALLRNFDRDKFEHAVGYGGQGGVLESEFESLGVELLQLSPKPLNVASIFKINKILRRIREYDPDIIHSHMDLVNIFGLAAKKYIGCRVVLHFHGLGTVPHKLLLTKPFKHRIWNIVAKIYRNCDKAIAICNFQLPFLSELGFKKDQVKLIPNGISLDVEIPNKIEVHNRYTFVHVGRFTQEKNHSMLINAFKNVVSRVPIVKLVLVGDGPLRSSIEENVRSLGLVESVEFLGLRRDIPEILSNCDCFVLASRWELHPITILEAMRASLPVIASDVGGISDTVDDKYTGLLIEPENSESLSNAMIDLAFDEERGIAMGKNGAVRVREHFNNEIIAQQIENVYQDVLSDS